MNPTLPLNFWRQSPAFVRLSDLEYARQDHLEYFGQFEPSIFVETSLLTYYEMDVQINELRLNTYELYWSTLRQPEEMDFTEHFQFEQFISEFASVTHVHLSVVNKLFVQSWLKNFSMLTNYSDAFFMDACVLIDLFVKYKQFRSLFDFLPALDQYDRENGYCYVRLFEFERIACLVAFLVGPNPLLAPMIHELNYYMNLNQVKFIFPKLNDNNSMVHVEECDSFVNCHALIRLCLETEDYSRLRHLRVGSLRYLGQEAGLNFFSSQNYYGDLVLNKTNQTLEQRRMEIAHCIANRFYDSFKYKFSNIQVNSSKRPMYDVHFSASSREMCVESFRNFDLSVCSCGHSFNIVGGTAAHLAIKNHCQKHSNSLTAYVQVCDCGSKWDHYNRLCMYKCKHYSWDHELSNTHGSYCKEERRRTRPTIPSNPIKKAGALYNHNKKCEVQYFIVVIEFLELPIYKEDSFERLELFPQITENIFTPSLNDNIDNRFGDEVIAEVVQQIKEFRVTEPQRCKHHYLLSENDCKFCKYEDTIKDRVKTWSKCIKHKNCYDETCVQLEQLDLMADRINEARQQKDEFERKVQLWNNSTEDAEFDSFVYPKPEQEISFNQERFGENRGYCWLLLFKTKQHKKLRARYEPFLTWNQIHELFLTYPTYIRYKAFDSYNVIIDRGVWHILPKQSNITPASGIMVALSDILDVYNEKLLTLHGEEYVGGWYDFILEPLPEIDCSVQTEFCQFLEQNPNYVLPQPLKPWVYDVIEYGCWFIYFSYLFVFIMLCWFFTWQYNYVKLFDSVIHENGKRKICFASFGSYGDLIPLVYYKQKFIEWGFQVTSIDYVSMTGKSPLTYLEKGQFWPLLSCIAEHVGNVNKYCHDHIIISQASIPMLGHYMYNLQMPIWSYIKPLYLGFGKFWDVLINFIYWGFTTFTINIGSVKGWAPRSSDGQTLLREIPNTGEWETVLALGSSSYDEPAGLDPLTTYSTRKNTIYQYVGDELAKDHLKLFSKAKRVICHGGAGTMATAKACGAQPESISTFLDRDYISTDFHYSQDWRVFVEKMVHQSVGNDFIFLARWYLVLHLRDPWTFTKAVLRLMPLTRLVSIYFLWKNLFVYSSVFTFNVKSWAEFFGTFIFSYGKNWNVRWLFLVIFILSFLRFLPFYYNIKIRPIRTMLFVFKCSLLYVGVNPMLDLLTQSNRVYFWLLTYPVFCYLSTNSWVRLLISKFMFGLHHFIDFFSPQGEVAVKFVGMGQGWGKYFKTHMYVEYKNVLIEIGVVLKDAYKNAPAWYRYLMYFDCTESKIIARNKPNNFDEEWEPITLHYIKLEPDQIKVLDEFIQPILEDPNIALTEMNGNYSPWNNCITFIWSIFHFSPYAYTTYVCAIYSFILLFLMGYMAIGWYMVMFGCICGLNLVGYLKYFDFKRFAQNDEEQKEVFDGVFPEWKLLWQPAVEGFFSLFSASNFQGSAEIVEKTVESKSLTSTLKTLKKYKTGKNQKNVIDLTCDDSESGLNLRKIRLNKNTPTAEVVKSRNEKIQKQTLQDHMQLQNDVDPSFTFQRSKAATEVTNPFTGVTEDITLECSDNDGDDEEVFSDAMEEISSQLDTDFEPDLTENYLWKDEVWQPSDSDENQSPGAAKNPEEIPTTDFSSDEEAWQKSITAGLRAKKNKKKKYYRKKKKDALAALEARKKKFQFQEELCPTLIEVPFFVNVYDTDNHFVENVFTTHQNVRDLPPLPVQTLKEYRELINPYVNETQSPRTQKHRFVAAAQHAQKLKTKNLTKKELKNKKPPKEAREIQDPEAPKKIKIFEYLWKLAVKTGGFYTLYAKLKRLFKTNVESFCQRIFSILHLLEKRIENSIYTTHMCEIIKLVKEILTIMNAKYRKHPKAVWAPLVEGYCNRYFMTRFELQLAENPTFYWRSYDTVLRHYVGHLNQHRQAGVAPLTISEYRRAVNTNPYVDLHLQQVRGKVLEHFDVPEGIDGIQRATGEVVHLATARYYEKAQWDVLDHDTLDRVTSFMVSEWPDSLAHTELTPLPHIMKKINHKYSPGIPFIGRYKKKSQIRADGWYGAIMGVVTDMLQTGEYMPSIHHVFPKSQVVKKSKLDENPDKLRTVIAENMISYVKGMVFDYNCAKRQRWWDHPCKPGMPLTGWAFNRILEPMEKRKRFFSMDVTAFDSNLPPEVFKALTMLRTKGFAWHPQQKLIEAHLEKVYTELQHGYLVNLVEKEGPNVQTKVKGGSTGNHVTSFINSLALLFLVIYGWHVSTGKPVEEFAKWVDIANFGDDNLIATDDEEWDMVKMCQLFKKQFNIDLRIEKQGTLYEQEFLSKYFRSSNDFAQDFIDAGIDQPKYAILHNQETMWMRYLGLKNEKAYRFSRALKVHRMFGDPEYMLEKICGSVNLTAHHRVSYDIFKEEYEFYLSKTPKRLRSNPAWLNKHKFPTYEQIIRNHYTPKKIKPKATWLEAQLLFSPFSRINYDLEEFCEIARSICNSLPVQLFGDAEVDMEMIGGLFETDEMDLDCFIFLNMVIKAEGVFPSISDYTHQAALSPYKPCTNPLKFYQWKIKIFEGKTLDELKQLLSYYRKRIQLLTVIYYNLNQFLNFMKRIPFFHLGINLFNLYTYDLPKIYSFTNYLYWLQHGTSSSDISQYIPKDLYINHKRAAVKILDWMPKGIEQLFLFDSLVNGGSSIAEMIILYLNSSLCDDSRNRKAPFLDVEKNPACARWAAICPKIIETMDQLNRVVVSSCTGSGKTFWLPRCLLGRVINDIEIQNVVICLPRKILVNELDVPSLKKLRRGVHPSDENQLFAATYGHLDAINVQEQFRSNTVFMFDEFHEGSPEMISLYHKVKGNYPIIFLSATPHFQQISDELPMFHTGFKPRFDIKEIQLTGFKASEAFLYVKELDRKAQSEWEFARKKHYADHPDMPFNLEAPKKYGERILIIEPFKNNLDGIITTIKSFGHTNISKVFSGSTIPSSGHIVATQAVDAGITIKGITCVIDTGKYFCSHKGAKKLINVPNKISIQRRGRTGRDNDGLYVLLSPTVDFDPLQVPDAFQVCTNLEFWSKYYKIVSGLNEWDFSPLNINPYIRIKDKFTHYYQALSAFIEISLATGYNRQTWNIYQKLYNHIIDSETEYFYDKFKTYDLIPSENLEKIIHEKPYLVLKGFQQREIASELYFSNGRLDISCYPVAELDQFLWHESPKKVDVLDFAYIYGFESFSHEQNKEQ